MLEYKSSEQIDQENDSLTMIDPSKMIWNNFEKNLLIQTKTQIIDIYDTKEWTRQELDEIIFQYEKKWILRNYKSINPINVFRMILMNFEINNNDELLNQEIMVNKFEHNLTEIHSVKILVDLMSRIDNEIISKEQWDGLDENIKNIKIHAEERVNYIKKINKMKEGLFYYGETLLAFSAGVDASNPYNDNSGNNIHKIILRKWIEIDEENEKDHQKLLRSLLEICQFKKYSKYNELIYRPVYTNDGNYAYSCEKVYDIDLFVETQISRDRNPLLWDLAHRDKSTISYIKSQLKTCVDNSLPELIKDRTLFSFKNGIYQLNVKAIDHHNREYYTDKFYPYNKSERPKLKSGTVACKYFNQDMEYKHYDDWYDIQTPNIQKILDLQYINDKEYEEICRWMYIFMGRLLYEIGKLDGWQVIAFMKGLAGTGKGTTIKAVQKFFDPEDVGVLSNDGQKQFSVSALLGKLLFVAPEIKGDLSLPQATFQSMISGEDISVDIKHKTAETIQWEIPGMLAGNEVPGWQDNSGSIARRLIIFGFNKKVPTSQLDPELWNKIKENLPNLLRKCNLAYLDAVNKWHKKNIWSILPQYFTNRQKELSEQTNDLMKFLRSSGVVYGKNYYISEKDFRTVFLEFCKEMGKKGRYEVDKLIEPFQSLQEEYDTEISMVKIDRRKSKFKNLDEDTYPDKKGMWIRGMTIQDEANEILEDEHFVDFLKTVEKL